MIGNGSTADETNLIDVSNKINNQSAQSISSGKDGESPSRESSPNHQNISNHLKISDISPIKSQGFLENRQMILSTVPQSSILKLSNEEAEVELKRLLTQIDQQKAVVLECLENDCDGTKELDIQMTVRQLNYWSRNCMSHLYESVCILFI